MKLKKSRIKPTSDRETTEAPGRLKLLGLRNGGLGRDNDRVENETILVSLDLADHLGLVFGRAVVMDNTETSEKRHVDGHVVFSDSVHRRGQKRRFQGNALGDRGIKGNFGSRES
jgi:hypothetical protein